MRTLLLFFSLLITFPVFSQNYRTVLVDKEVYYDFFEKSTSRVIVSDSFQTVGSDTIIYHKYNQEFEEIHKNQFDSTTNTFNQVFCHTSVDTGFMGYKTILHSNGTDLFLNRFHDSIYIQTQANLNDTWFFYQGINGKYYEATVSNISTEIFLGITDSVKTIVLQQKDSLGNGITSPYDSLVIKISQNYGLIQGFNFFRFPDGVTLEVQPNSAPQYYTTINIIGIPYSNVGIKNLTAADVYDFDIGDEFHWKIKNTSTGISWHTITTHYQIVNINSKQYSSNGDSVFYGIHLQHYKNVESYDIGTYIQYFDTVYIGSWTLKYNIADSDAINTLTLQQDSSNKTWIQSQNGNRKTITDSYENNWNDNDCFPIISLTYSTRRASSYHKGLGKTYWFEGYQDTGKKEILYYKKIGVEWGNPINVAGLSPIEDIESTNLSLKVFPNPTNNLLNFQFTEPINNAEIRIYSSIGQLITTQNVTDTNMQFQVSDWSKGIYFYGIYVEGEVVKQGQILVED